MSADWNRIRMLTRANSRNIVCSSKWMGSIRRWCYRPGRPRKNIRISRLCNLSCVHYLVNVVGICKLINLVRHVDILVEVSRLVHVVFDPPRLSLRNLILNLKSIPDLLNVLQSLLLNFFHLLLMNLLPQNLLLHFLDFNSLKLQVVIIWEAIHELILSRCGFSTRLPHFFIPKILNFQLSILKSLNFALMLLSLLRHLILYQVRIKKLIPRYSSRRRLIYLHGICTITQRINLFPPRFVYKLLSQIISLLYLVELGAILIRVILSYLL